jgi:hypothetical protein
MKLDDALKVSLDALRMQILGAQVLLGFEFQGLFQDGFAAIPLVCRSVAVALLPSAVRTAHLVGGLAHMRFEPNHSLLARRVATPWRRRRLPGALITKAVHV